MAFTGKNKIPSEVRSPPLPPGLIKRTSNRLVKIIKNVTIEPALFIYMHYVLQWKVMQ